MTAPAAMPSEEDVARALCRLRVECNAATWDRARLLDEEFIRRAVDAGWHAFTPEARAILALFEKRLAPILAEKARACQMVCDSYVDENQRLHDRALSAEAALAAERERIAKNLQAQADALWERCETKRTDPPSSDEQADAAQAFALQKAAAAIRAQGE